MGNAVNIITTIKTECEKFPQLRMVSFVLPFSDGTLELWYIKANTMSAHFSTNLRKFSTFISANFQKMKTEVENSVCQCPALTQTPGVFANVSIADHFFMKIRASGPLL